MYIFSILYSFFLTGCVFDTTTFHLSYNKSEAKKNGLFIISYTPYSNIDSLKISEAWIQKGYFNNKDGSKEVVDKPYLCFNINSEHNTFFSLQNFNRPNGFDLQESGVTKGVLNYNVNNKLSDTITLNVYKLSADSEKTAIGTLTFVKNK